MQLFHITRIRRPNPLSAYGRSKLAGEKFALTAPGYNGYKDIMALFIIWEQFCQNNSQHGGEKDSLRVVFDQTGSPTYAADLADAIMTIVSGVIRNQFAFNAGIYNYSNEGVCTWYDFATEIINEAGLSCK